MKTTLQMRDELGKLGVRIQRVPCFAPYRGFVFRASFSLKGGIPHTIFLHELIPLIRYMHSRIHLIPR